MKRFILQNKAQFLYPLLNFKSIHFQAYFFLSLDPLSWKLHDWCHNTIYKEAMHSVTMADNTKLEDSRVTHIIITRGIMKDLVRRS